MNSGAHHSTSVEIGGLPIGITSADGEFIAMLERRYEGFLGGEATVQFEVDVVAPTQIGDDQDLAVRCDGGRWTMTRGDFRADFDPVSKHGKLRQGAYPYAIDSVMRIVHSLMLVESGGFLLHAASVVRYGRAFIFTGVSGAGKTTISRLAPPDVTLLTDEISYITASDEGYRAFGTPFAGELARPGENVVAPIGGLYFLKQGASDGVQAVTRSDAARRLLRNILFFADDRSMVQKLFDIACDFVSRVPVYELTFRPTVEVWNLIR